MERLGKKRSRRKRVRVGREVIEDKGGRDVDGRGERKRETKTRPEIEREREREESRSFSLSRRKISKMALLSDLWIYKMHDANEQFGGTNIMQKDYNFTLKMRVLTISLDMQYPAQR